MSRILTSIHGKKLGLDHEGRLLAPNGVITGNNGSQFEVSSPRTIVMFDDFTVNYASGDYLFKEGTDSATSTQGNISKPGGTLRFTTGDAGTGIAADGISIAQNYLIWDASNGNLVIEAQVSLSAITTCYVYLGFTDQVVNLEPPLESAASADTLTSNASDAVGWMFDTRMATDNWWLVGVKDDVDATAQNSGFAPVATVAEKLRIEIDADGGAVFYRNGLQVGTRMSNAIDPDQPLSFVFFVSKTSVAASMTAELDYLYVSMPRP